MSKQADFKFHLESIVEDIGLLSLRAHGQLPMYKASVKEAARRVRDEGSFLGNSANASLRSILVATSRTLVQQAGTGKENH